ncbi:MAG TPA: tape measure protein, partial [Methylophilaceae bacterium]|nr:tape measure protein [Methylophilaceae bacterium]
MIDITTIGLGVETSQVKAAARDLDKLGTSADKASRKADDLGSASQKTGKNVQGLSEQSATAARSVTGLAASLGLVISAGSLVRTLDEYTKFTAQIRIATKSQDEYNAVLARSQDIAKQAQSSISAVTTLYARLLNNTRDLGVSQSAIGTVVETVALALKAQGANAVEAESSMLQLSQAFGKGRLDGDELRTALEAMPNVMRQLAKSMGVPFGALKDLGEQGKLTTEVLLKAFSDPAYLEAVRAQAKETRTISGAYEVLKGQLTLVIGQFNEATGTSKLLSSAITLLAENAKYLLPILAGIATALIAIAAPAILAGLAAAAAAVAAIGLPVAAVIGTLTALGIAFQAFGKDKANPVLDDIKKKAKEANDELAKTPIAIQNSALASSEANLKKLAAARDQLGNELKKAQSDLDKFRSSTGAYGAAMGWGKSDSVTALEDNVTRIKKELAASLDVYQDYIRANIDAKEKLYALKGGAAAAKSEFEAFTKENKLNSTAIKDQIATQQEAIKWLNVGKISQSDYNAIIQQTSAKIAALTGETARNKEENKASKVAVKELNEAEKEKAAYFKDLVDDQIAYNAAIQQYRNDLDDSAKSVYEQVSAQRQQNDELQRQIDVFGMGESAVSALEVARINETAAAYEQNAAWARQNGIAPENIKYIEDMAQNYRELAQARQQSTEKNAELESLKKQSDAIKKTTEEAKRAAESLERSLTDALLRGFEAGKGFAENFKDTLINIFKTLILRPSIEYIVKGSGIASIFGSGSALAGDSSGGGIGGLLSQGKTLFDGISNGFDKLNFGVTSSIEKLGAYLATGNGGLVDSIGGFLGQYSNQIATGLAFLPAAFSLLKGDVKSAAFQGAGAGIGFAIGGPVGAGIGSFLGGAVGGLFGGKKQPRRTGAYASSSVIDGQFSSSFGNP